MSAVVSDTTSLIALAGQGRLSVLGACFEEVLLPDGVYAEWLAGDPTVIQRVQDHAFLRVATVTDTALLEELELLLDRVRPRP
jgi:predicted nucleic acid-binding protein